ncbi:hypothetical protein GCM10023191_007120 [Actinoallomurus oryzae]|uniref:Uncharacterized protein n=1 Tax=Actinoallomurus oryzae TaxID=502180 RepID=A0ABP8PCH6_9ACTN
MTQSAKDAHQIAAGFRDLDLDTSRADDINARIKSITRSHWDLQARAKHAHSIIFGGRVHDNSNDPDGYVIRGNPLRAFDWDFRYLRIPDGVPLGPKTLARARTRAWPL